MQLTDIILVIDDDKALCELMKLTLTRAGFTVETANDGQSGLRKLYSLEPSLVLLDVMMPKMNGWDTVSRIREMSDVPVIMLTSMAMQENVVRGLNLGADDYLAKPIDPSTLVARIQAVMRRVKTQHKPGKFNGKTIIRLENIQIDIERYEVMVNGERIKLSPTEFRLLAVLARHKGRVLPHQFLLSEVWGKEFIDEMDYLRMYISYLRQKLEQDPSNPELIQTEWNVGYRFG